MGLIGVGIAVFRLLTGASDQRSFEGKQITDWLSGLDLLVERGIEETTIAHAREMTPAAWLTWFAYNGEFNISGVIARI